MVEKTKDLIGQRFSRLVVISRAESVKGFAQWRCVCDCGNETVAKGAKLRAGRTKSCGCARAEHIASLGEKSRKWHSNEQKTPEYRAWTAMRYRCGNPNSSSWNHYGGRGIKVCPQWNDFKVFLADVGRRPSPKHSLDRINNDGHYEPGNVRWATIVEQANNKRTNCITDVLGEPMTVTEAARRLGRNPRKVHMRRFMGWSIERALS